MAWKSFNKEKKWIDESGDKVDNVIEKLVDFLKENNISIAHEDPGGSFIIDVCEDENIDWIKGSFVTNDLIDYLEK